MALISGFDGKRYAFQSTEESFNRDLMFAIQRNLKRAVEKLVIDSHLIARDHGYIPIKTGYLAYRSPMVSNVTQNSATLIYDTDYAEDVYIHNKSGVDQWMEVVWSEYSNELIGVFGKTLMGTAQESELALRRSQKALDDGYSVPLIDAEGDRYAEILESNMVEEWHDSSDFDEVYDFSFGQLLNEMTFGVEGDIAEPESIFNPEEFETGGHTFSPGVTFDKTGFDLGDYGIEEYD